MENTQPSDMNFTLDKNRLIQEAALDVLECRGESFNMFADESHYLSSSGRVFSLMAGPNVQDSCCTLTPHTTVTPHSY